MDSPQRNSKKVFCTVGTTLFDALVQQIDTEGVLKWLAAQGCTHLVVQIGKGTYEPKFTAVEELGLSLSCSWYRFKPTLTADMHTSQLIISHGGAGSIMEALGLGKPLVVVVNDLLMNNHQEELAGALQARDHLFVSSSAEGLLPVLERADFTQLVRYTSGDPSAFAAVVDDVMLGFVN